MTICKQSTPKNSLYALIAPLFLLVALLTSVTVACAQTRNVEMTVGKTNEIIFAPNETTKIINLDFFSNLNTASALTIDIAAPNKTVVSAKTLSFGKIILLPNALAQIASASVQEMSTNGGKFKKQLTIGGSTSNGGGATGGGGATICNGYSLAIFTAYYTSQFVAQYGRNPTSETELCDAIFGDAWHSQSSGGSGSSGGTGSSGQPSGSLTLTSFSLKDACNKPAKTLQVFTLDLSKIDAAERAAGFTLSVTINEKAFIGNAPATLKPVSDGKYAPNPLLLTALISSNDNHWYVKYSNGSVKRQLSLNKKSLVKIAPYNGYIFGASLPGSELTGGKMSVFTVDSQQGEYHCFKAQRVRQFLNGYPKS